MAGEPVPGILRHTPARLQILLGVLAGYGIHKLRRQSGVGVVIKDFNQIVEPRLPHRKMLASNSYAVSSVYGLLAERHRSIDPQPGRPWGFGVSSVRPGAVYWRRAGMMVLAVENTKSESRDRRRNSGR